MRDLYPGYLPPTEQEFKNMWKTALIVPDANILLHTLRYDAQTRKEVIATLKSLKSQVFIPYQVGLEFLRNWRTVESENRAVHKKVQKAVNEAGEKLLQAFNEASRHQTIDAKAQRDKVNNLLAEVKKYLEEAEQSHPDLAAAEATVNSIASEFADVVGPRPTDEQMQIWISDGKKRYEAKIPPGYMDKDKDGDQKFGDLVFWQQLLQHGKSKQLPTILICDERKEDWVVMQNGERISSRPELVDEYKKETGQLFYSYPLDSFLRHAKKYANTSISDSTIQEIEDDKRARTARLQKRNLVRIGKSNIVMRGMSNEDLLRLAKFNPSQSTLDQLREIELRKILLPADQLSADRWRQFLSESNRLESRLNDELEAARAAQYADDENIGDDDIGPDDDGRNDDDDIIG